MRLRSSLPIAGLTLLLTATVASAQPKKDAGDHYSEGLSLYAINKYKEAAVALEASYNAKADQKTLFAWAQATRLSGQCDKSRDLFAKYVANGANAKQTRAAFQLMKDCEPSSANSTTATTPTETSTTTETSSGTGSATGTGTESSTATESGAENEANNGAGVADSVADNGSGTDLGLGAPTTTQADSDSSKPWYRDWIAVGLLSAGVVSLGVSGFRYSNALKHEEEGEASGITYEEFLNLRDQSKEDRDVAVIFGAGGALFVGAGIAYLVLRDSGGRESASAEPSFGLQVDGQSAGFAYGGRF